MNYRIEEAVQVLARTPCVLSALLDGLSDDWTSGDEGEDTFSPFEVVGHLLQGERHDWIPRARIILESGEDRPFEPFDRFAHREESRNSSMETLLSEFAAARQQSLLALEAMRLAEGDLDRRGTHPELGVVTLRQLLAAWVVHDLGHLAQVARVMGKQYTDQVGPWWQYMPVLSDRTERA